MSYLARKQICDAVAKIVALPDCRVQPDCAVIPDAYSAGAAENTQGLR